jgi:hypothetical protein
MGKDKGGQKPEEPAWKRKQEVRVTVYKCPGPDCGKEYKTTAERDSCWNSHCSDPDSH